MGYATCWATVRRDYSDDHFDIKDLTLEDRTFTNTRLHIDYKFESRTSRNKFLADAANPSAELPPIMKSDAGIPVRWTCLICDKPNPPTRVNTFCIHCRRGILNDDGESSWNCDAIRDGRQCGAENTSNECTGVWTHGRARPVKCKNTLAKERRCYQKYGTGEPYTPSSSLSESDCDYLSEGNSTRQEI